MQTTWVVGVWTLVRSFSTLRAVSCLHARPTLPPPSASAPRIFHIDSEYLSLSSSPIDISLSIVRYLLPSPIVSRRMLHIFLSLTYSSLIFSVFVQSSSLVYHYCCCTFRYRRRNDLLA
ncbi:hypothetical protein FB451DRAFT_1205674, partial [Mycena latifolia]